jgi:hypothetical protein
MKYLPSPIARWKLKMERQSVEFFAFFNGLFHDVEMQIVSVVSPSVDDDFFPGTLG